MELFILDAPPSIIIVQCQPSHGTPQRRFRVAIHKINGRFYLIFTADNWIKDQYNKGGKIGAYVAFVGVADKVTGPYQHITWLKGAGCDSTLFADDDGKTYAIMPFGNEYLQEVDLSGIDKGDIKLVGQRKLIVARDNSDVGRKTSSDYMEGPWMVKRNGKYILFTAAPYRAPRPAKIGAAMAELVPGFSFRSLRKTASQWFAESIETDGGDSQMGRAEELRKRFIGQRTETLVRLYLTMQKKMYVNVNKCLAILGDKLRADGLFEGIQA